MANRNVERGKEQEREIVKLAQEFGFDAERAWGSNGRALGEVKECDNLVEADDCTLRLSAKRRKNIANYLEPPEGTDGLVVREDYGDNLLVIPLRKFFELIQQTDKETG